MKANYNSIRGPVASSWRREGERFQLNVSIPANTTATVYLPARDMAQVAEGGKAIDRVAGVKFQRMEDGRAVLAVGSGKYEFTSTTGAGR